MILKSEREDLIEDHHYLCIRAARKFIRSGVDFGDLVQIGAVGLIKAADRFDAGAGTPFGGYAWVLILGELMHYVRDSERMLRAPRRLRELSSRWHQAELELLELLGREATEDETAKYLGATPEEQTEVQRYRRTDLTVSVDALKPHEQRALSYTIDSQLDRVVIDEALSSLSAIEREILVEIYERDTPVKSLAERLGYSRRHISRLHRGALKKISRHACPKAN